MRPVWTQTAHLAMQKISSPYHCRIACHVVNVLLSTQLVSYSDLKDTIALAISSAALSGPAIFCDTAIELWLNMSSSRAQHQPGTQGMNGFGHMLEWISAKWNPSKSTYLHCRTYAKDLQVMLGMFTKVLSFCDPICMLRSARQCNGRSWTTMCLLLVSSFLGWSDLVSAGYCCACRQGRQNIFYC